MNAVSRGPAPRIELVGYRCPGCRSQFSPHAKLLGHDEPCPSCGTPASDFETVTKRIERRFVCDSEPLPGWLAYGNDH